MRVIYVNSIGDLSTTRGFGQYRWAYEVFNRLNVFKEKGKEIEMATTNYPKYPFLVGGLTPLLISLFDRNLSNYDIVHSIDYRPIFHTCIKGISVANVADFLPLTHPELINQSGKHGIKNRLGFYLVICNGLRRQLKNDYIITCSNQSKQEAIDLGFDKDKIFVTELGVDERFLHLPLKGRNQDKFSVGYVGSFTTRKNVIAFDTVMSKIDDEKINGYLYGSPFGYEYQNVIKSKPKNTTYMGFAEENILQEIYSSFDVMLMPSRYEGFGLPILEALSCGTPVILFKDALIPDEVKKGCILVKDEDEAAERIMDMAKNGIDQRLRISAKEYASNFTWDKTALETFEAYKRMIE